MKNNLKNVILLIVIMLLCFITSTNNMFLASTNAEKPKDKTEETSSDQKVVEVFKEAIIINDHTLFNIGANDKIACKQRILDITANINNIIKEIVAKKQIFVDIEIIPNKDYYLLSINDKDILRVTEADAEVNNLDKEELAQVWKDEIIDLIKDKIRNTSPKQIEDPTQTILIALVIFLIVMGIAELFRVQISKLIILIVEKLFRKLDLIINNIRIKKQKEKLNQNLGTAPDYSIKEETSTTVEDKTEENLNQRISVITKEINGIINILIRLAETVLVVAFGDYILYTIPTTNPYVSNFTHFCLSIIHVATESLSQWFLSEYTWESFGRIIVIITIASIIIYISRLLVTALEKIVHAFLQDDKGRAKRVQTITKIVKATFHILVVVFALVLILSELGVNITPIIAGASIIGLAISFGSQSLVKDLINGIFILIENQFGIGDVITIGGVSGVVEDMTLRVTTLRDGYGKAYMVPNGQVATVAVATKSWSKANLDISIAYKDDIDTAINIMKTVADDMYTEFSEKIIEEPCVLGVNSLSDSSVDIKITMKTKAGEHWSIEREYRRRIKYAFDKHNIEIPFPQSTVHVPLPIGYEKTD